MKIQLILACTLALTLAWIPESSKYHGPQHIPIIHKGVPVEPLAVQHARALHFAAVAKVKSHPEYKNEEKYQQHYKNNDYDDDIEEYSPPNHQQNQYHSNNQISYPIYQENSYAHVQSDYPTHHQHSQAHVQVGYDGYLIDTPEVQAAKAKHLAALHKAASHGGHYRKRRSAGSYVRYTSPIGLSQGIEHFEHSHDYQTPIDILIVKSGDYSLNKNSYSVNQIHAPLYGHRYSHEIQENNHIHAPVYGHQYSHETPVIDHQGHPVDTLEVQHAKARHFAAYKEAVLRNSLGYHAIDTPEVQHAKLQHFAAHAALKDRHY